MSVALLSRADGFDVVIAAGAYAEVIAVSGDPLKDVGELEHVRFVMHDGSVFKNEIAK